MRRLMTLAVLAFATTSVASAQGEPPKPPADTAKKAATSHAGKWSGSVNTDGGAQEVWLTLETKEGKLGGTAGSQMGETALYEVKVAGDTLTAGATISSPNGNLEIWYSLLLKGDTMSGQIDVNVQGQRLSLPVSFRRQP